MKTVALISGGKDSCFNMMCCIAEGHEIVALANLRPENKDELDSYMYQTVGHNAIDLYAEAMGICLYTCTIKGRSLSTDAHYSPFEGDEVEDMYQLLQNVKQEMNIEAVSVGAILSDYQRVRVENVCNRLDLTVLSYLWRRDQEKLLMEMMQCDVKAKIIKVAAMGLTPSNHLLLDLDEIYPHMLEMKEKYGLNVCGEGGEYETFVYDCPLFRKKIVLDSTEIILHSDDAFAPVGYINITACSLEDKDWDESISLQEKVLQLPMMTSKKWIEDHVVSDALELGQSGGGDTGAAEIILCVPDLRISGNVEPLFHTDGIHFNIAGVIALVSEGTDISTVTEQTLHSLRDCLNSQGLLSTDITSISLYVGDIANFAAINKAYKIFFDSNPPVRLCVQANLPRNVTFQLDCQGKVKSSDFSDSDRKVMHVQALSHWAPANIGPYSQAVLAGGKLFLAGMVPLVPATLDLVQGGITTQCAVSLMHVQSVITAMHSTCTLGHCPLVMCYVINREFIQMAQEEWAKALQVSVTKLEIPPINPLVQYCVVPALPKNSLVEWQMYAWPFIDKDDIEEIKLKQDYDKYTISSIAKWCREKKELFSCSITLDATTLEDLRFLEVSVLVGHLLQEYTKVCDQQGSTVITPLVKVFFLPTVFGYLILQNCFSEAISKLNGINSIHPPVVSLIPVSSLQTKQQLLAWCQ